MLCNVLQVYMVDWIKLCHDIGIDLSRQGQNVSIIQNGQLVDKVKTTYLQKLNLKIRVGNTY